MLTCSLISRTIWTFNRKMALVTSFVTFCLTCINSTKSSHVLTLLLNFGKKFLLTRSTCDVIFRFFFLRLTDTVQITFIFIGQTHLVFGTCVTKHSNAFGMNRNCTFCVCLFSQILICDLWALGGFSFGFGFSFRNRWSNPFER